jgi:hypothetical protein
VKKTGEGVKVGVKKTGEGVKKTGEGVKLGVKRTGEGVKKAADGIGDGVKKTGEGVKVGVKKTGEGVKKAADGIGEGVKKTGDFLTPRGRRQGSSESPDSNQAPHRARRRGRPDERAGSGSSSASRGRSSSASGRGRSRRTGSAQNPGVSRLASIPEAEEVDCVESSEGGPSQPPPVPAVASPSVSTGVMPPPLSVSKPPPAPPAVPATYSATSSATLALARDTSQRAPVKDQSSEYYSAEEELHGSSILPAPTSPATPSGAATVVGVGETCSSQPVDERPAARYRSSSGGTKPALPALSGLPMGLSGEGDRRRTVESGAGPGSSDKHEPDAPDLGGDAGGGADALRKAALLLLAGASAEAAAAARKHRENLPSD